MWGGARWMIGWTAVVGALTLPTVAQAFPPDVSLNPAQTTGATTALLSGSVAPGGLSTRYHFEYAPLSSVFCDTGGSGPAVSTTEGQISGSDAEKDVSAGITGLTNGDSYCFLLKANNAEGTVASSLRIHTAGNPMERAPVAGTDHSTVTGATTASISGYANAKGQNPATVEVQYDLASTPWCASEADTGRPVYRSTQVVLGFDDDQDHDVTVGVTGLTPGARYCAVIVARNPTGASNPAHRTITFQAGLPTASTDRAVPTGAGSAALIGAVNPSGQTTTVLAEYGPAASQWCREGGTLGSPDFTTPPQAVGSAGTDRVDVAVDLTGLVPGTRYCAHLRATNASGTSAPTGTTEFTAGVPIVSAEDAESTGAGTANVTGRVSASGQTTTYRARYDLNGSDWCQHSGQVGEPDGETVAHELPFTDSASHPVTVGLNGLFPGETYCAILVATNPSGTVTGSFVRFVVGHPQARTNGVDVTSNTAATVLGEVNPSGQATTYRIHYDLASSFWCVSHGAANDPAHSTAPVTLGFADSTLHPVSVPISGLTPNTRYCVQVEAVNATGKSEADTVEFLAALPPTPRAGTATAIGPAAERVTGTVNPNGLATTYVFEYGLDSSDWCQTGGIAGAPASATPPAGAGAGAAPMDVQADLTGLTPGARYCWALSATNPGGTRTDRPATTTFVAGLPPAPTASPTPTPTPTASTTPTPTASPTPTATGTPTPTPAPAARLGKLGGRAKVVGKTAKVKLACLPGTDCAGTLTLAAKLGGKKAVKIGNRAFTIPAGTTATLPVKLSAKARRALRDRPLKAAATASTSDQTVKRAIKLIPG